MKPIFKSFYPSIVVCCICLPSHAASSHELIRPMASGSSFEQEMAESMSKMDQDMAAAAMTGDPDQTDLLPELSGLATIAQRLEGLEDVAVVRLTDKDVVRHPLVGRMLSVL